MAPRTYVPLLMTITNRLCIAITRGTPVLTRLYGNNAALMAALASANAACTVLGEELAKVRAYGD